MRSSLSKFLCALRACLKSRLGFGCDLGRTCPESFRGSNVQQPRVRCFSAVTRIATLLRPRTGALRAGGFNQAFSNLLCAFISLLVLCATLRAADKPVPFELREGDRVVFLGDTFMEREQQFGWIELMLTTRFPDRNVTFRNLGWSADTPAGDSRFGLSLLQAGHEPADEGWNQLVKQLEFTKPTVVFVGYGMASSFDGEAGLPKFKEDYERLLDTIEKISPGVRFFLLGPLAQNGVLSEIKLRVS